jgi:hypothetical protein
VREAGWRRAIVGLYLLLALAYSLLLPPWEAPDESAHYRFIFILARERRFPTADETYEYGQPPTYYLLAAGVVGLLDRLNPALAEPYRPPLVEWQWAERYNWQPENYRLMWGPLLLRWLNIGAGAGALLFIGRATRRLAGGWRVAEELGAATPAVPLATMALAGLTPQFLHVTAAISNDALAFLAGAALFDGLSAAVVEQPHPRRAALPGAAALFAPFVIKLTLFPASAALLLALAWRGRWWRPAAPSRFALTTIGGCLVLAAGLIAANPGLARLLGADVLWRLFHVRTDLPPSWPLERIVSFFINSYWGQVSYGAIGVARPVVGGLTLAAAVGWLGSLRMVMAGMSSRRFWWLVGSVLAVAMVAVLVAAWWRPWLRLAPAHFGLAVLALAIAWAWQRRRDPAPRVVVGQAAWAAVWMAAGLALLTVLKNTLATPQYHGRFLFASAGPISLLTIAGLYASLPPRWAERLPHLVVSGMVAVNLYYWLARIIPVYYQPGLG